MNQRLFIIFLITGLIFLSCTRKHIITVVPEKPFPGEKLFMRAESLFHKQSYDKALESYKEYFQLFPGEPLAPAALMKIGEIYAAAENYGDARKSFMRIIESYPKSFIAPDAQIAVLSSFYQQKKFKDVMNIGPGILGELVSKNRILKALDILGNTFLSAGFPSDAVYYYSLAYDTCQVSGKEHFFSKLENAAERIDYEDIMSLVSVVKKKSTGGLIMYLAGIARARDEKYEDALKILTDYIDNFPGHKYTLQAAGMIKELENKSRYNHHTIGCLLPLSGSYKIYGNRALRGIELALDRFVSQGMNPSLKIIIKDTGSDPDKAASGVERLYQEGAAAVIGPIFTAEPAAVAAQSKGLPIVTITQKDQITLKGDYVFRNFYTPAMQVNTIISYAVEDLGIDKFAILYPEEKYGTKFMNLFWDEAIAYGCTIVGLESYDPHKTDFAEPIKKIVGLFYDIPEELEKNDTSLPDNDIDFIIQESELTADPDQKKDDKLEKEEKTPQAIVDFDALFIPDEPKRAGLIIPQLSFYDIDDIYLFSTNLWHSDRLIDMAGEYVQGAIMPDVFFKESKSPEVQNFVAHFKNVFGKDPGFIEAIAYDTATILFDLVTRPEISFRATLKNELKNLKRFNGVTGPTSFDENGDVHKKLYLLKIKGDKFVEVEH